MEIGQIFSGGSKMFKAQTSQNIVFFFLKKSYIYIYIRNNNDIYIYIYTWLKPATMMGDTMG